MYGRGNGPGVDYMRANTPVLGGKIDDIELRVPIL